MSPNSPYEVLFGQAPKTGLYFPQQLQALHSDMASYVSKLQRHLNVTHKCVFSSITDPDSQAGSHELQPGDWVVVNVRKSLEPRFEGPFQVQLIKPTSVKLEGKNTWVHASHCKKVPALKTE